MFGGVDGDHVVKLFVAMPYGEETGRFDPDDPTSERTLQFDDIWTELIRPAIPKHWNASRADELHEAGLIDQLYTEWLLEADVLLADLTFANANVFYELGIRQALSEKSTVLIAHEGSVHPFDVRNQKIVHYNNFLATSVDKFREKLRETLIAAGASPKGSPVHTFLPGLFIGRFEPGKTPDIEIADLKKKIEELRSAASIELGTAAQFERRLAVRSELTDLLSRIIRAQLENAKLAKEHGADATYVQAVSATLNQENAFLLNEATMLIDQIPDLVGSVEYNTVAYSLANSGQLATAEDYYGRAIEAAPTPYQRSIAQRSFAFFLFSNGRRDEARALYREALAQLPQEEPFTRQVNGLTRQYWATNEAFLGGDSQRAATLFAEAQGEFEAVDNPPLRAQLLATLQAAQQGVGMGVTPSADIASGLRNLLRRD